jgi:hypothetical protein
MDTIRVYFARKTCNLHARDLSSTTALLGSGFAGAYHAAPVSPLIDDVWPCE